jgi:hypothetical protein
MRYYRPHLVFLVPILWPLLWLLIPVVWVLGLIEVRLIGEESWWIDGGSRMGGC